MSFDHFDLIARLYARVEYSKTETMREMAALPAPHARLLDVGGGTGRVSSALCGFVNDIVLADISFGMLTHSPRAALRPVRSYSESLPFPDDSFARVIMVDALHHVADHAHTAREMFRVLQPGGRIVIEEPDIETFGVKLIALAEKLLLMRSHFLSAHRIAALFPSAKTSIHKNDSTAWVVVEK
jgi:demethylmenaquinone methyltransferase/2-methoxy-6-polyprenyl-1,4-benzoquinol methylase